METVFDVGANVGTWSCNLCKLFEDTKIHAFEPNPLSFNILNTENKNKLHRINKCAVGDKDGNITLYLPNDTPSELCSVFPTGYPKETALEVEMTTLDNYAKRNLITYINLIKIDVEGNELAVLKGSSRLLKLNQVDLIQFEFSRVSSSSRIFFKDIYDILISYGYKLSRIHPHGLIKVDDYDPNSEYRYSNHLAYLPKLESALPITTRF
ncbi:FkbM family methyltransferase [bacterium]|nr:FkbM family methyltransferase [bacterium]